MSYYPGQGYHNSNPQAYPPPQQYDNNYAPQQSYGAPPQQYPYASGEQSYKLAVY